MVRMTDFLDLRTPAKRFRLVAVLEALTWLGLLVGMYFKHLHPGGAEVGVKVFGPLHGVVFMLFLAVAVLTALALNWSWKVLALALVSSVPPFGTVVFEWWAARNGHLAELSERRGAGALAG